MRPQDYIVLIEDYPEDLAEKVKEYLSKGWVLQGGVSFSMGESDTFSYSGYAQAMIKPEAK